MKPVLDRPWLIEKLENVQIRATKLIITVKSLKYEDFACTLVLED